MNEIDSRRNVLEMTLHDGSPAELLHRAGPGECRDLTEFTLTPAPERGQHLRLVLPDGTPIPHAAERAGGVEAVENIGGFARHHLHLALNCAHDQAAFLRYVVTQLGGTMKVKRGIVSLRLSAPLPVIEQIREFLQANPGIGSNIRIGPVFPTLASRPSVDDLAGSLPDHDGDGMEERTLRITGDTRILSPQIEVVQFLEQEKRLETVQLSCHPHPPGTPFFEMIAVVRSRSERLLDQLPGALISGHAGVYGAEQVHPDKTRQYVQVVTDLKGAGAVRAASNDVLQTRYKRWAEPTVVVAGSLVPRQAARLVTDLAEAGLPHLESVPTVRFPAPVQPRPEKPWLGHGAFGSKPVAKQEDPRTNEWRREQLIALLRKSGAISSS